MKRSISLICVILLLLSLFTACGNGQTAQKVETVKNSGSGTTVKSEAKTAGKKQEPVKISFENHGANKHEIFQQIVKLFNESQSEVIVDFQTNTKDWEAQLTASLAAGTVPDIITHIAGNSIPVYAKAGHLQDLTNEEFMKKVEPAALKSVTYNGKVYAIPLNTEVYGIFYNRKLFKRVGIESVPKTYQELKTAVDKLKKLDGIAPFAVAYKSPMTIGWWAYYGAGPILFKEINKDPSKIEKGKFSFNFAEYKNCFKVFDLINANTQPKPNDTDYAAHIALFANEKAAMFPQGNWCVLQLRELNPKLDAGMFPFPLSDDPNDAAFAVDYNLVINVMSKTKNLDAVRKFLNFIVDAKGPAKLYYEKNGVPTAIKGADVKFDSMQDEAIAAIKEGKTVPYAKNAFPKGLTQEVDKIMQEYVSSKTISVDEVLKRFDDSLQKLLKQSK